MKRIKLADTAKAEIDLLLEKLNIKQSALSQIVASGKNANYLSGCLYDGTMPEDVLNVLVTLGCDRGKLEAKAEQITLEETDTDMRKAVMNGIMDAWLIIQKQTDREAMVKNIVLKIMEDPETYDALQTMLFHAINGALKNQNGKGMNDGLVPQKWSV